jgi:hypothetical protein
MIRLARLAQTVSSSDGSTGFATMELVTGAQRALAIFGPGKRR